MRKAFTLMEVNLAMLIMAGGILSLVGLYSFGYRENSQSREDVASAALAESVISPLAMAISSTNLKWSTFKNMDSYPSDKGWYNYFDANTGIVKVDPTTKARGVFNSAIGALGSGLNGDYDTAFPEAERSASGLMCGLVVMHERDSPIVRIAFRATKTAGALLSMPLYYTEVRFQGVIDQ